MGSVEIPRIIASKIDVLEWCGRKRKMGREGKEGDNGLDVWLKR